MKNFTINRFYIISYLLLVFSSSIIAGCSGTEKETEATDITIENAEMRLILGNDGTAKSLVHKSTGEECLMKGVKTPVFVPKMAKKKRKLALSGLV